LFGRASKGAPAPTPRGAMPNGVEHRAPGMEPRNFRSLERNGGDGATNHGSTRLREAPPVPWTVLPSPGLKRWRADAGRRRLWQRRRRGRRPGGGGTGRSREAVARVEAQAEAGGRDGADETQRGKDGGRLDKEERRKKEKEMRKRKGEEKRKERKRKR